MYRGTGQVNVCYMNGVREGKSWPSVDRGMANDASYQMNVSLIGIDLTHDVSIRLLIIMAAWIFI
jgi:hypothetical protein